MSLALKVLQNRMEKASWVARLSMTALLQDSKGFSRICPVVQTYQKPRKTHKPQKRPPNKKTMKNSNNLVEDYLYTGMNIYQIKQIFSYFAFTVRHSVMSGNGFPTSCIKMLCHNPLHRFRGMLFDSLWMVHRRNNQILRRFNNKHLLENFRALR